MVFCKKSLALLAVPAFLMSQSAIEDEKIIIYSPIFSIFIAPQKTSWVDLALIKFIGEDYEQENLDDIRWRTCAG